MKELLPKALAYLGKGYSVIPVGADKRPLISWKEFQTRHATPDELVAWWTQSPDAQIGIVTGKISNLTVIDVEAEGDFNLIKDATYEVKTGGGGRHYYFQYEADFKNAVRVFPFVDVRSEGGYVVAAGSQTQKGAYVAIKDVSVAQMSESTKQLFKTQKDTQNQLSSSTPAMVSTIPPKINTEALEYSGAGVGGRNDSMAKFAGTIHAKLHPSLWSTVGWQIFETANYKNNPPLGKSELRATWESIGNIESRAHPGGRTFTPRERQNKTWGPAEPEIKKVVTDPAHVENFGDNSEEKPALDPQEAMHVSDVAAAQLIDSENTYPMDMPPFDEALLGGFSLGELVVVAGQSGHGKTTLIQDWTVTLASGGQTKKAQLPCLWFSYEVLAKPMWEKFQKMGASAETPIYMPRVTETGDLDWVTETIEKAIAGKGIKIIAIDHLGFLRSPKGNYANAADAVTQTVRALKRLAVKHGLIIMLPVHIRKTMSRVPDLNDIRDSLGIAQEADSVFFIAREKDSDGMPSTQSKVWLIKNRKSGASTSATFDFQFGRYYYNPNSQKKDKEKDISGSKKSFKEDPFGNDDF